MSDWNSNLFASGSPSATLVTPTTGQSIVIGNNTNIYLIKPAGTLVALTVTMPAVPYDGQIVRIGSSQVVTTLTLSPNSGQSLIAALPSLAVGGFATYYYRLADTTWYRIG